VSRRFQVHLHDTSTRAPGATGGFERFTPELQAVAAKRLAVAAFLYGGGWTAFFLANWIQHIVATGSWTFPDAEWALKTLIAVVISASVVFVAKSGRISPRNFVHAAAAFQLFGALLLVHEHWGWETRMAADLARVVEAGADLDRLFPVELTRPTDLIRYDGINAVAIWLLLFPLTVPIVPGRALAQALVTASTVPAFALGSVWAHGMPDSVAPIADRFLFDMIVPVYIVAGLATFAAHVVYWLTRDLSKARELGSYRLVEKIGTGGMGEVWRAEHQLLARPAAVKLIRQETKEGSSAADSATALKRFEREAQATAALASPHTIEVYDFGIAADGTFYYVMELLDGLDLRTLVERFGPLPAARTVHILKQAAHSLWDAHLGGLVHRDVKPANVFVGQRGPDSDFVKVLDFGLVKETLAQETGATQLTVEGIASGTPAFMAPETASGSGKTDARADLYALGCVAYWLLTGQLVFEDPNPMGLLVKHVKEPPAPPSTRTEIEVPEPLDRLVLDLLAKDPADRPRSARELLDRLEAIEPEIGSWTQEQAQRWWSAHRPRTPEKTPRDLEESRGVGRRP
jgi:serine/threonine-protein kinase